MTDASTAKPQALNPIKELERNFSTFTSMYQALVGVYQGLPIDDNIKFITIHAFNEKYAFTEKLLQQVFQQMSQPTVVGIEDANIPPAPLQATTTEKSSEPAPAA